MTRAPKYVFINVLAENVRHPNAYETPKPAEVRALAVGDFVKVGVTFSAPRGAPPQLGLPVNGELFWLEVTSVHPCGVMGVITNTMLETERHGLQQGDLLMVDWRHIMNVLTNYNRQKL